MIKRFALILTALVAASPAQAAPEMLDAGHSHLWDTLESKGVQMFLNDRSACVIGGQRVYGLYLAIPGRGAALSVCQQFSSLATTEEVPWSAEDGDTIRHESMHFLQDCVDGNVDMSLDFYFDGDGPSPGKSDYPDVISAIGPGVAAEIDAKYRNAKGADATEIRLEHEAFYVAANIRPELIAHQINVHCPVVTPNNL